MTYTFSWPETLVSDDGSERKLDWRAVDPLSIYHDKACRLDLHKQRVVIGSTPRGISITKEPKQ